MKELAGDVVNNSWHISYSFHWICYCTKNFAISNLKLRNNFGVIKILRVCVRFVSWNEYLKYKRKSLTESWNVTERTFTYKMLVEVVMIYAIQSIFLWPSYASQLFIQWYSIMHTFRKLTEIVIYSWSYLILAFTVIETVFVIIIHSITIKLYIFLQ